MSKDNMTHKELMILADTLQGEINRMCVTNELRELDTMHLHARKNLEKLWDANYERLRKANKNE